MAILNKISNDGAFPNEGGIGMSQRQWYKGQALASFPFVRIPSSDEEIVGIAQLIGLMADALIEEDRQFARQAL